jgi:hypothetical protein
MQSSLRLMLENRQSSFFLGSSLVLPWVFLGSSLGLPWFFLGSSLVLPWFCLGSSLVLPWFFPGARLSRLAAVDLVPVLCLPAGARWCLCLCPLLPPGATIHVWGPRCYRATNATANNKSESTITNASMRKHAEKHESHEQKTCGKTREPRAESNVQMPCSSDWPQLAVNERNSANTSNLPIPQISETSRDMRKSREP